MYQAFAESRQAQKSESVLALRWREALLSPLPLAAICGGGEGEMMTQDNEQDDRSKKERSPSYPFISLRRAVERASALYDKHRREPARLATVAPTWGYGVKSSGLQQTVGAMKQYGLLDDSGSGDERKIVISELARRILVDLRPGAKEQAIREAATKPRLFSEYSKWFNDRPSDQHCISELIFDRGFNDEAAKAFLKAFDDTVEFAGLANGDSLSSSQPSVMAVEESPMPATADAEVRVAPPVAVSSSPSAVPFARRIEVKMGADVLTVSAILTSADEVDRLIRILEVNRALLDLNQGM